VRRPDLRELLGAPLHQHLDGDDRRAAGRCDARPAGMGRHRRPLHLGAVGAPDRRRLRHVLRRHRRSRHLQRPEVHRRRQGEHAGGSVRPGGHGAGLRRPRLLGDRPVRGRRRRRPLPPLA
jgi:hypothetical protein